MAYVTMLGSEASILGY